jgi:hypothetical protein
MESNNSPGQPPGLSAAKRALLEQRLRGRLAPTSKTFGIPRRAERGFAPLSFDQQKNFFIRESQNISSGTVGTALRLKGRLGLPAFERSLSEIIRRHESLRTTFNMRDGQLMQVIGPPRATDIAILEVSFESSPEMEAQARRLAVAELEKPFDLAHGPPLHVTLIRLSVEEHVLALAMDHMVSDYLSLGLLLHELAILYDAFSQGRGSSLAELPVQFGDWTQWQRGLVEGGELETQLHYWRTRLEGDRAILALPFARRRPCARTFHGRAQSLELPIPLADALRELSRRQMVSLYTTLLAAFKLLVHYYTGREDIMLGRGVPGRTRSETEKLIGCFVNLLVMRTDLSGNPTFAGLLQRVSETVNGAYANQEVPFVKLADELQPGVEHLYPPLVQIVFNLYTSPALQQAESLDVVPFNLGEYQSADETPLFYDLILGLKDSGKRLIAEAKYNPDIYDAETITRMLGDYQALLTAVSVDPQQPLQELSRQIRAV